MQLQTSTNRTVLASSLFEGLATTIASFRLCKENVSVILVRQAQAKPTYDTSTLQIGSSGLIVNASQPLNLDRDGITNAVKRYWLCSTAACLASTGLNPSHESARMLGRPCCHCFGRATSISFHLSALQQPGFECTPWTGQLSGRSGYPLKCASHPMRKTFNSINSQECMLPSLPSLRCVHETSWSCLLDSIHADIIVT